MDEVELKLLVVDGPERFAASGFLPGKGRTARQRSTYFDTADGALSAAGVSLRIRQVGTDRTQTIKSSASLSAGLFVRSEWTKPVNGGLPVIDDETPVTKLIDPATDPFQRAF